MVTDMYVNERRLGTPEQGSLKILITIRCDNALGRELAALREQLWIGQLRAEIRARYEAELATPWWRLFRRFTLGGLLRTLSITHIL